MKTLRNLVLLGTLFMVASSIIMAAEYTVRRGDNLTRIALLTGHEVDDLVLMNEIKNPNMIIQGQKIIFLGKQDLVDAAFWTFKRSAELINEGGPETDSKLRYYEFVLYNIRTSHYFYSAFQEQPSGTYYKVILGFAEQWREHFAAMSK